MSNSGVSGDYFPPFALDVPETKTSEQTPAAQAPAAAPAPQVATSGWDNVVAAVRSATKKRQGLLLTLTADNMSPIWIDLHTKRYYTENELDAFPQDTVNPKLYAKLIDPNDPPFPWVNWRSIDAILWTIGGKAFEHRRARWLILGERYSLVRWPNLTQIPYGPDELNAISMLANGLLTVEELALVSKISVEKSAQLISTLSFMGVLRGTGAPRIPLKVAEAMQQPVHSLEELQRTYVPASNLPTEEEYVELPEDSLVMDEETRNALSDADHIRQQLDRPAISSMSLPELPDELYSHDEEQSEEVSAEVPQERQETQEEKSYREETAKRFSSMPSFEEILAQQNLENEAIRDVAQVDKKDEPEEKPSGGLFGLLKKLRKN